MSTSLKYASGKGGLSPGSLVHVGDVHQSVTQITVVTFGVDHYEERQVSSLEDIVKFRTKGLITWVVIEGLADAAIIESIGGLFNIHPLVLEDILNTHQRPKLEEHENYLFVVLKSLVPEQNSFAVNYEQISLLVLDGLLFTIKEKVDPLLDPVLTRLKNSHGRMRRTGADYLMYAILDTIIDQNFVIMDQLEETLVTLENEIFSSSTSTILGDIHEVKLEVIKMRRFIAPIRDLTAGLLRSESGLIQESTHIYLRDVHDHVLRIIESIETYRDILSSLLDIYLSNASTKLNEVMKVLTVFAAIFIPLSFVAGIYGMNFKYMPELNWKWGYLSIWIVFISISVGLLSFFRKKGWI